MTVIRAQEGDSRREPLSSLQNMHVGDLVPWHESYKPGRSACPSAVWRCGRCYFRYRLRGAKTHDDTRLPWLNWGSSCQKADHETPNTCSPSPSRPSKDATFLVWVFANGLDTKRTTLSARARMPHLALHIGFALWLSRRDLALCDNLRDAILR